MKPAARRAPLACILIAVLTASASAQLPAHSNRPATAHHAQQDQPPPHKWAIVLHGGAGVIERSSMSPQAEKQYRAGLRAALSAAARVLSKGGSSLNAVQAAIEVMEDNPLFNAGRGAVFAANGTNQMDAAIMDGATMRAGAVADVQHTRHPIALARAVMEKTHWVLLSGQGADDFSLSAGLQQEPSSYFFTEPRWDSLVRELKKEKLPIPPRPVGAPPPPPPQSAQQSSLNTQPPLPETPADHNYGTVGVVALDVNGNIAAGTSTGGLTAKRWNRIGDSPLIGAGTYASNQSCAVSGTGIGEYFIRYTVARTICALVQYKHMRLQAAADEVIQKQLAPIHGDGGIIAITPDGQIAWSFNTPGMFRAKLREGGKPQIAIYHDEP
ncbi:MAG TPA: isoaspartyl peptidase/L-asparaginase [Acidobacteriaceae bacterium]|nr:isoaspartyl peptidase/L-asparaginase [Acidobacteriaceae bacterium]